MRSLTLTIKNLDRLNAIQRRLSHQQSVSKSDKLFLSDFLSLIPSTSQYFAEKIPQNTIIAISVWDLERLEGKLTKWLNLFGNLPGWDYCPYSFIVDNDNIDLLKKKVILAAWFAPSYTYNCIRSSENRAYEVWLKDDGTAVFQLPTLQDIEQYPELYNFKGTWKEAYLLLIETLKNGWPMEEFPEELQQFLKM